MEMTDRILQAIKQMGNTVNQNTKKHGISQCEKTNFHDQDAPYDIYCHETAALRIESV